MPLLDAVDKLNNILGQKTYTFVSKPFNSGLIIQSEHTKRIHAADKIKLFRTKINA